MKIFSRILFCASMLLCFVGLILTGVNPAVEAMNINLTEASVVVGGFVDLDVTFSPNVRREVKWSSSDSSIAQVSEAGVVTGIATGEVVVSAYYENFKAECEVEVVAVEVEAISIECDCSHAVTNMCDFDILHPGNTMKWKVAFTPSNATYKDVVWESSNPLVASVNNGYVRAENEGTAIITATASNGVEVSKKVVVQEKIDPTEVSLDIKDTSSSDSVDKDNVAYGEYEIYPDYRYAPSNADLDHYTLSSSNPSVASINEEGNLQVHKDGKVTVTATWTHGFTATMELTIPKVEAQSVQIWIGSPNRTTLDVGETLNLSAGFFDVNGMPPTTREVEWIVEEGSEQYVSVDANGVVTALASTGTGKAVVLLKVKGVSSLVTDSIEIKVN